MIRFQVTHNTHQSQMSLRPENSHPRLTSLHSAANCNYTLPVTSEIIYPTPPRLSPTSQTQHSYSL
ncbi:hypothetical protein E2C01_024832 [Portunus trituberculatus]|uniref:Uncharacterized protein n=1 Tax=Portunus trituberculatus TaxID=210409 RepID=A0A5B7EDX2_PORTR|nr:hypothetical protein [Portunus trituberculatus]